MEEHSAEIVLSLSDNICKKFANSQKHLKIIGIHQYLIKEGQRSCWPGHFFLRHQGTSSLMFNFKEKSGWSKHYEWDLFQYFQICLIVSFLIAFCYLF